MAESSQITASVSALKELIKKRAELQKPDLLTENEEQLVYLQINLKLISCKPALIPVVLPHSLWTSSAEVCLFVADVDRSKRTDHDETVTFYTDMLEEMGVKGISEIIPFHKLMTEYKPFEAKRNLCCGFDIFLCDNRIIDRVTRFLGKEFLSKRKAPRKVNLMKSKTLKEEFKKAFSTVVMTFGRGSTIAVEVAQCRYPTDHIVENIIKVCDALETKAPGGWKNIASLHVKTAKSLAIPIYFSTTGCEDVGIKKKRKRQEPVTDEITTLKSAKVAVRPDGSVKVLRVKDEEDSENK